MYIFAFNKVKSKDVHIRVQQGTIRWASMNNSGTYGEIIVIHNLFTKTTFQDSYKQFPSFRKYHLADYQAKTRTEKAMLKCSNLRTRRAARGAR
jgi:hypothetical protein